MKGAFSILLAVGFHAIAGAAPAVAEPSDAPGARAMAAAEHTRSIDLLAPSADTLDLPGDWPEAFPALPPGGRVAGYVEVPPDELPTALGAGPYYIATLVLPAGVPEAFRHYHEGLARAGWQIDPALTDDGSRGGPPTVAFRGHGHAGDLRMEESVGVLLVTVHLYREPG